MTFKIFAVKLQRIQKEVRKKLVFYSVHFSKLEIGIVNKLTFTSLVDSTKRKKCTL